MALNCVPKIIIMIPNLIIQPSDINLPTTDAPKTPPGTPINVPTISVSKIAPSASKIPPGTPNNLAAINASKITPDAPYNFT